MARGPLPGRKGDCCLSPKSRVNVINAFSGDPWDVYRIPSQYVVDVLGLEYAPTIFGYENASPVCSPWASPSYERAPAPLVDDNYRKAIARKSLGRTVDGREILQRTRTSARDFEYVERSLDK